MVFDMTKPTLTATFIRTVLKDLNSNIRVDSRGLPTEKLVFPKIDQSTKAFRDSYLAYNIARKREVDLTKEEEQEIVRSSLVKWTDSEWTCFVVNSTGRYMSPVRLEDSLLIESILKRFERLLHSTLSGRYPDLSGFNFTSGATSSSRRMYSDSNSKASGHTDPASDLDHNLACNKDAQVLLEEMLENDIFLRKSIHMRRWKLVDTFEPLMEVDSAKELAAYLCQNDPVAVLDYVAKDIKSVRLLAKSGGSNICVQKTLGDTIRVALLEEFGIDLSDQTINQEWAEIGSLTGLVATVDLSSASDNIALSLLNYLPTRWKEWCKATRDREITVRGSSKRHTLQKIAGMGNGFIFELETLIFHCLNLSVCTELNLDTSWTSCYGDDIITPSAAVDTLTYVFSYLGFSVNTDKSYSKGPFRESCGKHYHNGIDVTPIYIKGDLNDDVDKLHVLNGLGNWSQQGAQNLSRSLLSLFNTLKARNRICIDMRYGTRAGLWEHLYQEYPGVSFPTRRYCKRLHRFVTVSKRFIAVKRDERDRFPDRALLYAGLKALESARPVYDGAWVGKNKWANFTWPLECEPVSLSIYSDEQESLRVRAE